MTLSVKWVDAVGSTNTEAMAAARAGVPHGWAIAARHQREGRGRLGRRWEGHPGNLHLSVVLRPACAPARLPWITLGAGVVLAEILDGPFRLKWPNDLLDGQGRKLAGILTEAEWEAGEPRFVVVGIGVNLVHAPGPGTTCSYDHGIRLPAEVLAEKLVHGLVTLDLNTVPDRWKAHDGTLGREVTVGEHSGLAIGLDTDGALLIRRADGSLVRATTGDLGFIDPDPRAPTNG